jgi:hypothetical protein
MHEARAFAHLPLLLIVLVQVGCAPAPHTVRFRTADGEFRVTTPAPRAPMALPKEEVHRAVRALAKQVVPVADPAAFARERFGMPVMEGVYLLDARTKELKPADKATEANEEPPPEMLEQARKYLRYCEARQMPGDCFGALHGRRTLDAHGRYTVAMGIAIAGTFEATHESLKDMLSVQEVLSMVVAGVTMYAVLWVLPEPTSKGLAAAITIVMVGYVGVHTLYSVGTGFADLIENSEKATTFEALHDEGERFAGVMGADTAQVLVMVATAAVGSGFGQFLKVLPKLPGAPQASQLAVAEGGVSFEQLGSVEGVTIGKGGLTISLSGGAVLATSLASVATVPESAVGGSPSAQTTRQVPVPTTPGGVVIDDGKIDYLLGRASGSEHNIQRAGENAAQMRRIGVHDTAEGRALLRAHFDQAARTPSNVTSTFSNEHGTFEVRESLFSGPGGHVKFRSTWQVLEGGARRLTTAIPFGG